SLNVATEKLAVLGSRFGVCTISPYCEYNVEMLTRPAIPDNIKHWQVFNNDVQVQMFMQNQ
ncbi:hypothetical protein KI387_021076, partial [Taxus chinensis]